MHFRTLYHIWPKSRTKPGVIFRTLYQNPHKFGTKPGKSFERGYAKLGRDSRFFAADEANLSAEGGDSLK